MTTDWTAIHQSLWLSPYYFTAEMKDCYIFDNPHGYSIKELMLLFDISADEVMQMFDRGLSKFKHYDKKGGRQPNERQSKMVQR